MLAYISPSIKTAQCPGHDWSSLLVVALGAAVQCMTRNVGLVPAQDVSCPSPLVLSAGGRQGFFSSFGWTVSHA